MARGLPAKSLSRAISRHIGSYLRFRGSAPPASKSCRLELDKGGTVNGGSEARPPHFPVTPFFEELTALCSARGGLFGE
jgi:hypothetical protein